jgi:alpha-amylase
MRRSLRRLSVIVVILALVWAVPRVAAQAGFDDDRVMLQGFYWESHRHGHPGFEQFGPDHWYTIVRNNAEAIAEDASISSGCRLHPRRET